MGEPNQNMNEAPLSRLDRWRDRLKLWRAALRKTIPFFLGMAATLAAILLYTAFVPAPRPLTTKEISETVANVLASATPPPAFSAQVYAVIQPSLVLIQSHAKDANGKEEDSLGSGVIITDGGDILTSLHVVANATVIELTFADGTQSSGQVITQQPENDIAVVRADQPPAKMVPAVLGNPNAMSVGDEAYAVGNPFGLYSSMSAGVISGFGRTFQAPDSEVKLTGMIQIDTAVNPGNSGGPLLNRYGQVVGIITGILNPSGQDFFVGIGFAVPITTAGGALGSPPY
jgi:S1-C subfamily serine protease